MADKVLAGAVAFFLLGTLGLYGYAVNVKPELLGPGMAVGAFVFVEGTVLQVRKGWGGELKAELRPDDGGPPVRLRLDETLLSDQTVRSAALTGARLRAEGILEKYMGTLELRPAKAADLTLLAPSSLNVVWERSGELNNTSVALRGLAFYKHVKSGMLTMRIVDGQSPSLEINCSCSNYRLLDERPHWENGTLVRVMGRLKFQPDGSGPHIYLSGGARGVLAGG